MGTATMRRPNAKPQGRDDGELMARSAAGDQAAVTVLMEQSALICRGTACVSLAPRTMRSNARDPHRPLRLLGLLT
ncbi:hypothetical protein GCM10027610_014250 [Dactylosporangium cerinum]